MRIASIGDAGNVARARRVTLGLTQIEVAKRVGVFRVWLYKFEHGSTLGSEFALILRLFDALGLDLQAQPRDQPTTDHASDDPSIDLEAHLARFRP
jgi:transcriptional regulator with XRE-family HTH domain